MTSIASKSSDFIEVRKDGWKVTVRSRFQSLPFPALFGDESAGKEDLTVETIRSSDYTTVKRFIVKIDGGRSIFYSKEYLNRSLWDSAKHLFRPSRAKRAFLAGLLLHQNGLHTSEIVAVAEKKIDFLLRKNILITLGLENTQPLFPVVCSQWSSESGSQILRKRQQIAALGSTVGRMHAAGIFHGDLRGGNIFVGRDSSGWCFNFIDNERTRRYQRLPFSLIIKNLVQLNMLPGNITPTDRMRFLKAYRKETHTDKETARKLAAAVQEKTQRRLAKRARTHTEKFLQVKSTNYQGVFSRSFCDSSEAKHFLEKLNAQMEAGELLKDDRSTRVVRCQVHGNDIVIKRYNYQGLWHSLRHTIKGSRAGKCWQYGHLLAIFEIPCARPLAFIEERKAGLICTSYIVNEFVPGPLLHTVMNTDDYSQQEQKAVMEKAAQLLKKMGQHRLTHSDMKPANLLICCGRPVLIDLDSMHYHRLSFYFRYRYRKMVSYFYRRLHGKNGIPYKPAT